tara:strand:+ start:58737 stop:59156 length:420 start_codon:yes stop_codon:yes gene_type:complete
MGTIIGLDGKAVHPVAIVIREALLTEGSVSQSFDELTVSILEWRRAAREVARALRRPIKTTVKKNTIEAVLLDWPCNEHELRIHERIAREAIDAIALADEMVAVVPQCPACGCERAWRPGDRIERSGSVTCPNCGLVEL